MELTEFGDYDVCIAITPLVCMCKHNMRSFAIRYFLREYFVRLWRYVNNIVTLLEQALYIREA
jgi:hypothetical protein